MDLNGVVFAAAVVAVVATVVTASYVILKVMTMLNDQQWQNENHIARIRSDNQRIRGDIARIRGDFMRVMGRRAYMKPRRCQRRGCEHT